MIIEFLSDLLTRLLSIVKPLKFLSLSSLWFSSPIEDQTSVYKTFDPDTALWGSLVIFNKDNQDDPALINPGDKVKFKQITKDEYDKIKS